MGQTLPNGRDLRWNRIAIPHPRVRHTRRSPHRRQRRETEAKAYNGPRQRRRQTQRRTYCRNRKRGRKMRAQTKIQKKRRAQMKQVTMAHHMQMSRPHPKRPHLPRRCDKVVFPRIPCYVACATSVQPLCNLCKHSLSRGCTHLHSGCTSYLRRTSRGNGGSWPQTGVWRHARSFTFRPVVVSDGACWKDRMVATDSPSVAKANLKKVTINRRKAKSWSESHRNGKKINRSQRTSCGPYASSRERPHLQRKTTRGKQSNR